MSDLTVGFIGLGNMGSHMARNLVAAGFTVVGADLDAAKVDALVAAGGSAAVDAIDAARQAHVVMTSLPGPPQLRALAPDLLAAMPTGSVWVDLSTNNLACATDLAAQADAAGVALIDAPVTGGWEGAEAGTLSVLVGGEQETYDRVVPLFAAIGDRYDLLGSHGAGYVAKISQVILCYLNSVCLTEALLLGVKGGVEPAKMLDIIRHSTGRSYVADRYGPEILSGGYDDTFDLELAAKDLRIAMELADDVDAELPFTSMVTGFYRATVEEFGAHAPHLIAMQALERRNDLILHDHPSLAESSKETS